MKVFVGAVVLVLAFVSIEAKDTYDAKDFLRESAMCIKEFKIPTELVEKFRKFDYPDEPAVHSYIRCVMQHLDMWDAKSGLHMDVISKSFMKQKPEATKEDFEFLVGCNENKANIPPTEWVYKSFICILGGKVGDWFRDLINEELALSSS